MNEENTNINQNKYKAEMQESKSRHLQAQSF